MIPFIAHLPSVIFTRRGSGRRRKQEEESPPSSPREVLKDESALRRWSERSYKQTMEKLKIEHVEIPKLEQELEKHKAEYDRADQRLKALTPKLRRLNNQLISLQARKDFLKAGSGDSFLWSSSTYRESTEEEIRALSRQIASLSDRVDWLRGQIPILKEIKRIAGAAIKEVSAKIRSRQTELNLPDPFFGPVKDFLFGPDEDPVEEPIEEPIEDPLMDRSIK